MKVYEELAVQLSRLGHAKKMRDRVLEMQVLMLIDKIERETLPSGSGFDSGVKLNILDATSDKLVIDAPFHRMDEHGSSIGWEDYTLEVEGILIPPGIKIRVVKGGDCEGLRDYVEDVIFDSLTSELGASLRAKIGEMR
jgi:hypothetical protein